MNKDEYNKMENEVHSILEMEVERILDKIHKEFLPIVNRKESASLLSMAVEDLAYKKLRVAEAIGKTEDEEELDMLADAVVKATFNQLNLITLILGAVNTDGVYKTHLMSSLDTMMNSAKLTSYLTDNLLDLSDTIAEYI